MNEIIEVLGSSLIAKERSEQIHKHGRTIENDITFNSNGELIDGAITILLHNTAYYPKTWSEEFRIKMLNSSTLKQLVVAGALIAAEIDRYINVTARKYE